MPIISIIIYSLPLILIILWLTYNVRIAFSGMKSYANSRYIPLDNMESYHRISIIIPAKNEGKVIGRVLEALLKQDYPRDMMEIIVVDGMSTDGTFETAFSYSKKYPDIIKVLREKDPHGKPAALNYAMKYVSGDIIGVFDADSIPEPDVLKKVSGYFQDEDIKAVQGMVRSVNEDQNILTKLISLEEKGWFNLILKGRDRLNLFIPFTGSCLFIRRSILMELGGWKEDELAEDIEFSLRMLKKGYSVKYAGEISSWQEAPSSVKSLISQRTRWYRGYIKNLFRYGSLIRKPSIKSIDAEILLSGPLIMVISLFGYLTGLLSLSHPILSYYAYPLAMTINILTVLTIIFLIIINRPLNAKKILTALSIYPYWILEALIAFKSLIEEVFKRPMKWVKTEKTGVKTSI